MDSRFGIGMGRTYGGGDQADGQAGAGGYPPIPRPLPPPPPRVLGTASPESADYVDTVYRAQLANFFEGEAKRYRAEAIRNHRVMVWAFVIAGLLGVNGLFWWAKWWLNT